MHFILAINKVIDAASILASTFTSKTILYYDDMVPTGNKFTWYGATHANKRIVIRPFTSDPLPRAYPDDPSVRPVDLVSYGPIHYDPRLRYMEPPGYPEMVDVYGNPVIKYTVLSYTEN